jgi:hypothetical protein
LTLGNFHYVSNLAPALWIPDQLHPFAQDVGSVIPEGFEDYARVFHPAYRDGHPVSWREIAAANGRTIHSQMQFGNIAGSWHSSAVPDLWKLPPRPGTLPIELARAIVSIMQARTNTPGLCWFAVWAGLGQDESIRALPRLVTPGREYYVASGPLESASHGVYRGTSGYQSANMWWPDDRAWFVATEVDLAYTYAAGTQECIDAVVTHPEIEALRARLSDRITWDGDTVNPSPGRPA